MDNIKTGQLIFMLRREKHMTQKQLAELMHISDKAVSKWERGLGCPDVSLLPELSSIFAVDLERLLSGDLQAREILGGNMKKMHLYVCPHCGNLMTSLSEAGITCCGKKLTPLVPQKAEENERLHVEIIENEYYVTTDHPMERDHYISFVALLTSDSVFIRRQYPEWNLQTRIPRMARGRLLWYCTQHGLFEQNTL